MNCGHLNQADAERGINGSHDPEVGCLVVGGTKYIENEDGKGYLACSCLEFVPSPEAAKGEGQ